MQALDEYEQLVLAGLYGAGTPGVGVIEQEYPNLTVQKYRQHAYAISTNPQFRREIDDILDGLRKGGVVQEQ
jgi:hypothetical protein